MNSRFKIVIAIWLAALSAISVATLCRSFYRDIGLSFDYIGIMVGILSALCTVLIGWQIYSLIDFNKREENNKRQISTLQNILKGYVHNNERGDYLLYDNLSEICENIISQDIETLKFERLHYKISAINYASRIGEIDVCEAAIATLNNFVEKYDIKLNDEQRDRLLKFVCLIPNQQRIKNFTKLINAIVKI